MATPSPVLDLLLLAELGMFAIAGVRGVRLMAQRTKDRQRVHYLLSFPREMDPDQVIAFIRSLGGLSTGFLSRLHGLDTVAFEVHADETGIKHRLCVPAHQAGYIIRELRGHLPGVRADVEPKADHDPWDSALEIGMTSQRIPLHLPSSDAAVNTLLAAMTPLQPNQAMLLQWIVAPNVREKTSNDDKEHQTKHSDHTFMAVGRLAARADNPQEAELLIRRMYIALSTAKKYGVAFKARPVPKSLLHARLNQRGSVLAFPCVFNARELAAVIAFPAGNLNIPGLSQGHARHLAADPILPKTGFILGTSNFPGNERPIALGPDDLLRHLWIGGPTGTGKSTALHNLASQIIHGGHGLLLLEPKGDLVQDVLNSIPDDRIKDVILFDPSDTHFPVGLNILADSDPERITGHVVALFKSIFGESWGPRLEYILRYAVLTAALKGLSLYDVKQLLLSPSFRRGVVRGIKNPEVREFWVWFDKASDQASDSVVNKLDAFLGYSVIRNIIGQPTSGFSMTEVINQGKILLVPLSSGLVGDSSSSMLGSLIVSLAWQAARGRAGIPREDRQPFYILIDEFQNYLNLPVAIGDALAQARGYGVGMVLANQHLGQLKTEVKSSVMANARSKIIFQTSAEDARSLASEFQPFLTPHDLQNLGRYEAVLKLMAGDLAAPPATAYMHGPPRSTGSAWAVRQASRAAYGKPVGEVERDFQTRHRTLSEDVKRPSVGREDSV